MLAKMVLTVLLHVSMSFCYVTLQPFPSKGDICFSALESGLALSLALTKRMLEQ